VKSFLPVIREKSTREAPHYKARQAFYLAFFSKDLYIDVIKRWRGLGVFYFFIMISVMALPLSIQLMGKLNQAIEAHFLMPIKRLPPLSIRSGEVIFHSPMPYLIKDDDGEVISIIDTEGHINQLPARRYPFASILITKHNVHFNFRLLDLLHVPEEKQPESKDNMISLAEVGNQDFFAAAWLESSHVKRSKIVLVMLIYPMVVIFNALFFMTILLSVSLFAQFAARMAFKVRLSFSEASRLLFVAVTPLTLICSILVLFHKTFPKQEVICIAFLAMYFSFGVLSYRRSHKMVAVQ